MVNKTRTSLHQYESHYSFNNQRHNINKKHQVQKILMTFFIAKQKQKKKMKIYH